jgi:exonuclease SbcC
MRTLSTVFHNFGPFLDFTLDLESVDGTLVALVAPNGSGKTFALETAWLGTCYREMATQGSLLDRATARDSFIESTTEAEDGERYVIRHAVDSVARTSESIVKLNGKPVYKGTKVSSFDAWAAKHLPSKEVQCSTVFAVQGSAGFLGLPSAQRISVILQAVGVAQIERMAEGARKNEKATKEQLKVLATRISDARQVDHDVTSIRVTLESLGEELATAELSATDAQQGLDVARELAGSSALAAQRYTELLTAWKALTASVAAKRLALSVASERLDLCDVEAARASVETAKARAEKSAEAFAVAQQQADNLRDMRSVVDRRAADRARVTAELGRAKERLAKTSLLVTNNQYVLDHAEELRDALSTAESLKAEIQRLELQIVEMKGRLERHDCDVATYDADRKRHSEDAAEAERRWNRACAVTVNAGDIRAAVFRAEGDRNEVAFTKSRLASAERILEDLQGRRIAGASERISALRGGLLRVVSSMRPAVVAEETLRDDDATVTEATELPGMIADAQKLVADRREDLRLSEERLRATESLVAQLPAIEAAETERDTADAARARSEALATAADAKAAEAFRASKALAEELRSARTGLDTAKVDLVALDPKLKRAAALETAEGRLAELRPILETETADVMRLEGELVALPELPVVGPDPDVAKAKVTADRDAEAARIASEELVGTEATRMQLEPQVSTLRTELSVLETQLAATPEPTPPGAAPALETLEGALQSAKTRVADATRAISAHETRLEQARAAEERIAALEAERRTLELELADWTRLALDLGRDGIQSAEVDSAGPQLTALTNDLLLACHGPRYSVRISTTRAKADGKGEIDECRVMVTDSEDGTEREAKLHSGGERVILGEAVSLALSMMACDRAGVRGVTLVRDESGAALDPKNARGYIAMLRHAAKVTRADKVIFVSHSREIQALADATIEIGERRANAEAA